MLRTVSDIVALLDGVRFIQAFFVKEPPEIKTTQSYCGMAFKPEKKAVLSALDTAVFERFEATRNWWLQKH